MVDIAAASSLSENMAHPMGMFSLHRQPHALYAGGAHGRGGRARNDVGPRKGGFNAQGKRL